MKNRLVDAIASASRSQLLGVLAQISSAAPIIAMSIYLAHAAGLAAVAEFTVLVGASTVAFTICMTGLRPRMVIDQFQAFAEPVYVQLRIISTVVMAVVIVVLGAGLGASTSLILGVTLLRAGDAALDLVMAMNQVRRHEREHMYGYLNGSLLKIAVLAGSLAVAELTNAMTPYVAFALSMAIYTVYAWGLFLGSREVPEHNLIRASLASTLLLLRASIIFAIAQILCALLTNSPRFALPGLPDQEAAGAAAAALSVSTLVGMVFYAVWLRWMPRFGAEGLQARWVGAFGIEVAAVAFCMIVGMWIMGSTLMRVVFGIENLQNIEISLNALYASVPFFLFMTSANIFKITRFPWIEIVIYTIGLIFVSAYLLSGDQNISIPSLMIFGAAGMLAAEVAAAAVLLTTGRSVRRQ